ncbi:transposase, partial [Candidatus Hakubella thermalkaliphila]
RGVAGMIVITGRNQRNTQFNLGFRRFRLRGLDKAGGEWTLVCLVHNIKKIYTRIMAKGGELDDLTRELQAAYNPA